MLTDIGESDTINSPNPKNDVQALAYKTGELKIRELRARSEKTLGEKFDLRLFHDAVLENGAVPLSVLEDKINAWIETQK